MSTSIAAEIAPGVVAEVREVAESYWWSRRLTGATWPVEFDTWDQRYRDAFVIVIAELDAADERGRVVAGERALRRSAIASASATASCPTCGTVRNGGR